MKLVLSVIAGPMKGELKEFSEADIFLVGRSPDCHVHLPKDGFLSRHHCLFEINPPDIILRDLGSLNGTFVNGARYGGRTKDLKPEDASHSENIELKEGDRLKLGDTEIIVKIEKPAYCSDCNEEIPEDKKEELKFVGSSYLCKKCRNKADEKNRQKPEKPATPEKKKVEKEVKAVSPDDLPFTIQGDKEKKAEEDPAGLIEELLMMILKGGDRKERDYPEIRGYQILKLLGKGGFGAVYLAKDEKSGKDVALKTMLQTRKPDLRNIRMFEREIENTRTLRHKNIVDITDYGNFNGIHYFALEMMNGGSLWDLMKGGKTILPLDDAVPIMLQSLEGLAHAHKNNFIHRDLKPPNILLSGEKGNWTAKVSDFGLAKNFSKAGLTKKTITFTGECCGSPPYMAPEHITNYRFVKPPTDVFEMAATFYHMLTGKTIWDISRARDPFKVILQGKVEPVRNIKADLPEKLARVIDKALSRDLNYRYRDGGEMLEEMKKAMQGN